jgi:DNA polymerase-3 subunit beta
MELVIEKSKLLDALASVSSFIARKTTMPILNNFLVKASQGKLIISATDLEITAIASAAADVKTPGSTTVNARVFGDIVRELPDGEIKFKLKDGERFEIFAKNSKIKINAQSSEEFPSLPGMNVEPSGRVSAKELSEAIGKTLYAASQDETRFNLNGVCFELVNGKSKKDRALRLVATDGHRLGMVTRQLATFNLDDRMIVPRKGLTELKRIIDSSSLASSGGELGIEVKDGFLVVETDNTKMSIHLIDAQYPDYNQVIPKSISSSAVMAVADITQALRRIVLLVSEKTKGVKFEFSPTSLRLSSSSPDLGEGIEEIPVKYDGEALTVGFNAVYFLDFLNSIAGSSEVKIELSGPLGPGKLSPDSDDSCIGIIMPMRL